MALFATSPIAAICSVFASALRSPFGWACSLLILNYGSWEIGMVCGSDGILARVGFTVVHVLGRTELAPLGHLPAGIVGIATVLLPIIAWI